MPHGAGSAGCPEPYHFRCGAALSRNSRWRCLATTVVFHVATYDHYRGSVITPFHGEPVSPSKHHLDLTDGVLLPNGGVRFRAYLDGGIPEAPSNVMTAVLKSITAPCSSRNVFEVLQELNFLVFWRPGHENFIVAFQCGSSPSFESLARGDANETKELSSRTGRQQPRGIRSQ